MPRLPFSYDDIAKECQITHSNYFQNDCNNQTGTGIKIHVPAELTDQYPYNASAYTFLQELRREILEHGIIEFPNLPVNKCNHTIAMRAPEEHTYSSNPYLTDHCQSPHQDTPPYPTAFWLGQRRRFAATWIMNGQGLQDYMEFTQQNPGISVNDTHRRLVSASLKDNTGVLLNFEPGLLLIDNSQTHSLYHCRTTRFDVLDAAIAAGETIKDTPMYAYNEIGLLNYINTMDERRGPDDRDKTEADIVQHFMKKEKMENML